MNNDEMMSTTYLQELYNTTQGDTETQISMHDVGAAIGMEKADAGRIAEDLMVQGYIELKTLAGAISITDEGLLSLGITPTKPTNQSDAYKLSPGPVVIDSDREIIAQVTQGIKSESAKHVQEYSATEQTVFDLKVIELHLLSPSPKTVVLLELFKSLGQSCAKNDAISENSGLAAFIAQNQTPVNGK
ncbi:MAG: hypothetical protein ACI8ZB_000769 [Desulforhopalus sp.]|jgi:hypothetical protein